MLKHKNGLCKKAKLVVNCQDSGGKTVKKVPWGNNNANSSIDKGNTDRQTNTVLCVGTRTIRTCPFMTLYTIGALKASIFPVK